MARVGMRWFLVLALLTTLGCWKSYDLVVVFKANTSAEAIEQFRLKYLVVRTPEGSEWESPQVASWKPAGVHSQDAFALNFAVLASGETRDELIDRMSTNPHVEQIYAEVKPWKLW